MLRFLFADRYLPKTERYATRRCERLAIETDEGKSVSNDINILALAKGEERYIFLYNESKKSEALRMLGRYASNSELSFSWYDAAVLSQNVRQNSSANQSADAPSDLPAPRFNSLQSLEDLLSGEEPIV